MEEKHHHTQAQHDNHMQKQNSQNWNILWQLTKGDFKLRYQSSYLGYFWSLIKPLLLFSVIYLVFSNLLLTNIENYAIYLLIGIILWTFFSEATLVGLNSLLQKRDLVTKIYFPRQLIVIASTLSSSITLLLNLIILAIFLFANNLIPGPAALLFIPLLALYFLFTAGMTLALSAFYIKFHDLSHIWEVLLQIIFWLTPIIYTIDIIPDNLQYYIYLNPLTQFIAFTRSLFLGTPLNLSVLAILTLLSLIAFVAGLILFKLFEKKFAEEI